jgi:hypothetical protein
MATGKWSDWLKCRNIFDLALQGRKVRGGRPVGHGKEVRLKQNPYPYKYRSSGQPTMRKVKGCKSIW